MLLDGKVAIVTGSGLGIGRAHAIALAHAGARVVVNSRTACDVARVVNEIRQNGGYAEGCVASVACIEGAHRIIQTAIDRFGRIDVLVNNAGINRRGALVDLTEQDFDEVIAVNLKGQFLCAKAAVPYMIKQRWGRIINMSSNAVGGSRNGAAYAASKAGVLGLSLSWALELTEFTVNTNRITDHPVLKRITRGLNLLYQRSHHYRTFIAPFAQLRARTKIGVNTFHRVPPRGVIQVSYDIQPASIGVTVVLSQLDPANWRVVTLLNEQGASTFTRYSDDLGLNLIADDIGVWDLVTASQAWLSSMTTDLVFRVSSRQPMTLRRGREQQDNYLSWAGLAYEIPWPCTQFRYSIDIQAKQS